MGYDSALFDKSMNIGTHGVYDVYIHITLGSHRHQDDKAITSMPLARNSKILFQTYQRTTGDTFTYKSQEHNNCCTFQRLFLSEHVYSVFTQCLQLQETSLQGETYSHVFIFKQLT